MLLSSLIPLIALAGTPDVFEGNAVGEAFIESSNAILGGSLNMRLGTGDPNHTGSVILSVSDGFGPTLFVGPFVGMVALDVTSPAYFIIGLPMNANNEAFVSVPVPNDLALLNFGPLYGTAFTIESGVASHSKTVRVAWVQADSSHELDGDMAEPRLAQTATPLGDSPSDNRSKILIAGGATGSVVVPVPTASTTFFQPAKFDFEPGPDMSAPRSGHTATRLPDGRVLIAGGISSGGTVLASAEIYSPDTGTFSLTSPMGTPRGAHAATLLEDGRVLVSGGFSDWIEVAFPSTFIAAMNTAQKSLEIFDPTTDTWTTLAAEMIPPRAGHTQTLLPDGRVFIMGGIRGGAEDCSQGFCGGAFPILVPGVEIFDPTDDSMGFAAPLFPPRAFQGVSVLGNGDVLVTGGIVPLGPSGSSVADDSCYVWDGNVWTEVDPLPISSAFHTQVPTPQGDALIIGGYIGGLELLSANDLVGTHDGTTYSPRTPLGNGNSARGGHSCTRLGNGSYLVLGGSEAAITREDGVVYVP